MAKNSFVRRSVRRVRRCLRDVLAALTYIVLPVTVLRDKRYFDWWQSRNLHALRPHFYSPVPDTRELPDELWARESSMTGVDLHGNEQLALLERFRADFKGDYEAFPVEPTAVPHRFYQRNDSLSPVDAFVLYGMIRHFKPKRMIEIGSGVSTALSAEALCRNAAAGGLRAASPRSNRIRTNRCAKVSTG